MDSRPGISFLKSKWLWVICIILIGAVVRLWDLAFNWAHPDDFGVAKSIIDARQLGQFGWFAVSKAWTYSPAQFLITPLLIDINQSYREILFWGRLPSVIFSVIGLGLWVIFYRMFNKQAFGELFLSLTLLVCSWENIIFARQMNNYALGVTASIGMLILLVYNLRNPSTSWIRMLINSVCLAAFSHMQYMIFFLLPAFWGTLFIRDLLSLQKRWIIIVKYIGGVISYGALIFPMVYYFVLPQPHRGIYPWNKGPNEEFFFALKPDDSFIQHIIYTIKFYTTNFFFAFESNIAFLPEGHALLVFITVFLLVLFVCGIVSFCQSSDKVKRYVGVYSLLLAITWVGLILLQKLTFSPSRHQLILLPIGVMLIASGFSFLINKWKKITEKSYIVFSILIVVLFLMNFKTFLAERRDPFDEDSIVQTLKEYQVDALLTTVSTQQVELMKGVRDYFNYNGNNYIFGQKVFGLMTNGRSPYRRVAALSFRTKTDASNFDQIRYSVNQYIYMTNFLRQKRGLEPLDYMRHPVQFYRQVYAKEVETRAENEYSRRTQNGHNGFYFYVFER